jgi:hypothetical protein
MASVNLTCTTCAAGAACASCRGIARSLRAAGHVVTQTSRYDALRAAMLGSYGFDACVLPVAARENAVLEAATTVLSGIRVALLVEPGSAPLDLPATFTVIPVANWRDAPFPTDWIERHGRTNGDTFSEDADSTRIAPALQLTPERLRSARQRLKTLAVRAQREIGAAAFADARLDPLALLEDEIAWAAVSGTGFGLVLLILPKTSTAALKIEQQLASLHQSVKAVLRSGDTIAQGTDSLLAILPEAEEKPLELVARRLARALRQRSKETGAGKLASSSLRRVLMGVAAYPVHGQTKEALLARATASAKPLM